MSTLGFVLDEVENKCGINGTQAQSLLSGLVSLINHQAGGWKGFFDRFRRIGSGDSVTSWLSGVTTPMSALDLENTLGHSTIESLAAKAGISLAAASSALALILPQLMQKLAPRGVVPAHLPGDLTSYLARPTAALASGARHGLYAANGFSERNGIPRFLWPLLALLAVALLGLWLWNRSSTTTASFSAEEQVRLATQKASAALGALKPGFTGKELAGALNLNIINFASTSAQLPSDSYPFLNQAAAAIKAAPSGTVLEIDGHTDNTGDAASNLQLSQQRADAVRDYLVQQGVDPTGLHSKAYGDTRPVASNDTEQGKFRNRRIEFTVAN